MLYNRTLLTSLSFDDGYLTHVTIARLLARMGIRATFYYITHLKTFEGKTLLATYPEYIREIAELGHEIGSHTCTHQDLTKLSRDELDYELKASRHFLEDVVGGDIQGMAYPYGYFDSKVLLETSKYYQYARSAAVYKIEDAYNVKLLNRYMISALTIHHLPKLPIKVLKHDGMLHPVLFAHNVHISKIVSLILYLKCLKVKFVTVKELVDYLMRKEMLCSSRADVINQCTCFT